MASNHTENYGLNQWERSDKVRMEDFNADNAKIDAALLALAAGQLHLQTGSYTGDGAYSKELTFPFYPQVLMVFKTTNIPEFMVIFGDRAVMHLGQDSFGAARPWHAGIKQGFYFLRDGNTITIRGSSGITDADNPMYAMNRKGSEYIYMALG